MLLPVPLVMKAQESKSLPCQSDWRISASAVTRLSISAAAPLISQAMWMATSRSRGTPAPLA